MKKRLYILPLMVVMFTMVVACSTEKAKWMNIQYHNTTCHYNVWWNGNESLKEGIDKLHRSVSDDYTQFLQVEKLGTIDNARNVYPEMDRAIEKGIKGIKKHSIFVKGTEYVPYIKECYLLTAYGTFYKQDYIATQNTCQILLSQFDGTHAAAEASVLMARCATMEKRYNEAETMLDNLVGEMEQGKFDRKVRDKLYLAMVEALVPQGKYKKAVEYIHLARECVSSSETKARLTYIMAQIYQSLDKRQVAAKYYHEVLSYTNEYVMEFNAKLGEASCADLQNSDIKKLERQLDDMLSDRKNNEYRDQIYYAKGEMYLGVKNLSVACENYKKSVAVATTNRAQKAKSALRLAEVLYENYEDYDNAQRYYDTVVGIINVDYPNYDNIKRRSDMLNELTSYTRRYAYNDSILLVASMTEEEKVAFIQTKIDTLIVQEKRAKEKALQEEMAAQSRNQQNTLKGDWYFYNESMVQKGKESFRQKWGMRVLEDYWCFENNTTMGAMAMIEGVEQDNGSQEEGQSSDSTMAQKDSIPLSKYGDPNNNHDIAYYLKDLPTTQQQFDSIDSLTAISLIGAAYLYYDEVHNTDKALECYLRLAADYTSYDGIEQAFYMLYRIYDKMGNTPQSNYYRDMVLRGFPDGDFANLIRDNEYYKQLIARDNQIDSDYEDVYMAFHNRKYNQTIRLANRAEENYEGSSMLSQFRYWKALAQAQRGNKVQAINTLEQLMAATNEADTMLHIAVVQLALLRSDSSVIASANDENISAEEEQKARQKLVKPTTKPAQAKEEPLPEEARVYRYRENQQHYVVVIINDKTIRATDLQRSIVAFNSQYYANSGLKVNAALFTDTTQILTIHLFNEGTDAVKYCQHLQQSEGPLQRYPADDHTEFVLSKQNYATFYNRKNIDAYMAFYKKYYINTTK